jgi:transposase
MKYYAALDVGLRTIALCIIDETGELRLERSLPSEVDDIVDCLRGFGEEIACVGLEAGSLTQWLTYGLRAAGFKPVVLEARQVQAALAAMRNKTDRNDARGIAQILRTGWYRPVHVKSIESHYARTLLAARKALLRKCIDLENEVRGLLKVFGIKLKPGLRHGGFDKAVRSPIEANGELCHALVPLLDVRLELYKAFLEMDRRVKALAHSIRSVGSS